VGIWGSSTVREVKETEVRVWEAGEVGRLSPAIRLLCVTVDARECEGGGEAARSSSVTSSSSSSRAVMRRLVLGRLTTVRGRGRGFG
jgi:uncharacterized protein (DUF3084 family)